MVLCVARFDPFLLKIIAMLGRDNGKCISRGVSAILYGTEEVELQRYEYVESFELWRLISVDMQCKQLGYPGHSAIFLAVEMSYLVNKSNVSIGISFVFLVPRFWAFMLNVVAGGHIWLHQDIVNLYFAHSEPLKWRLHRVIVVPWYFVSFRPCWIQSSFFSAHWQ